MNKQEFLEHLRARLSGLPKAEVDERLAFYSEMIDDRIEEGFTEQEAVADIGSVEEIASQIISDVPLSRIAKERIKPKRRLKAWEIVLLAVGSPIWLSLAIAAVAVLLSLYVVLWSLVISLWAIFVSVAVCALGGVAASVLFFTQGNATPGILMIGASLVCAGVAIFLFFGCHAATKGTVLLTRRIALWVKKLFMKKEE